MILPKSGKHYSLNQYQSCRSSRNIQVTDMGALGIAIICVAMRLVACTRTSTPPVPEPAIEYIDRAITIAENSTAFLKCVPNDNDFAKAEWLVNGTHRRLINSIFANEVTESVLTILDVTTGDSGTYSCRKSANVIERFHLNVHAPNITISDRSLIFMRNGGTINLTCTIWSVESPDEVAWYYNETSIETDQTQWQSKNRICMSEGIENCLIRTTFDLILKAVDLERSGFYSCATGNTQPAKVYVEVLNEPVLLAGSGLDLENYNRIFGYAIEALELYGIQKAAVDYVRDQCTEQADPLENHNFHCILSKGNHEYSVPKSYTDAYLSFKIGPATFTVYHP